MTKLPTVRSADSVDLIRDSVEHVLAVSFPKSKAAGYAPALHIAQQADKYADVDLNWEPFHYAVFGSSREQIAKALSVTRYLQGITASQFYAGGQLIVERHRIQDVLSCLMQAYACNDHRAHCNQVVSDPFYLAENSGDGFGLGEFATSARYLMPCAFLTKFGSVSLDRKHPASAVNQIQAKAVKLGCVWCPNFKPGDFKKL